MYRYYLWNLFERGSTRAHVTKIWAVSKEAAARSAFDMFGRPMDVDLDRKEYMKQCLSGMS